MRWTVILLLFCSSCQSKPSKEKDSDSKATLEAATNMVEIEAVVAYAPRRAQEIENTILLGPTVQNCLRLTPEVRDAQFSVGLEGYLNYRGFVENVLVTTPIEPLKACLSKEIPALSFGRGRMGPFKVQVIRPQNTGKKSKAVLLDLSTGSSAGKKWE